MGRQGAVARGESDLLLENPPSGKLTHFWYPSAAKAIGGDLNQNTSCFFIMKNKTKNNMQFQIFLYDPKQTVLAKEKIIFLFITLF